MRFIPCIPLFGIYSILYHFLVEFAKIKSNFAQMEFNFAKVKFNFAQMEFNFAKVKFEFSSNAKINFKDMKYISHLIYIFEKRTFIYNRIT